MEVKGYAYAQLYKARGRPRIKVTGLPADLEALFDGRMLAATSAWWNRYLDRRPAFVELGAFRTIDAQGVKELQRAVNPGNRKLFALLGADHSPSARRLGGCALGLAYAFARSLYAGHAYERWDASDTSDLRERIFEQAPPITPDDLAYYSRRYTIVADYYDWDEQSPGWWAERMEAWVCWELVIAAIRWAYRDQVRRWEKAEDRKIGTGIGWALDEGEFASDLTTRLFEQGGRLLEAEIDL